MLKVGITQEELDGKPRDKAMMDGLTLKQIQGKEVPQLMAELSSAHLTLQNHRAIVKQ